MPSIGGVAQSAGVGKKQNDTKKVPRNPVKPGGIGRKVI
jgi:hypothetical protein